MYQQSQEGLQANQYQQDDQQIYQPILDQQPTPSQQNVQPYQHYGQTQEDEVANFSLLNHINYVKSTFVQYSFVRVNRIDPQNHPNHPEYYNYNVQENLPFRLDTNRIENTYDASQPDVYKQCFLDPIAEDNQFQGWSESKLSHHPFMITIQELCRNLQSNVQVRVALCITILAVIQILNLSALIKILTNNGNGFVKFLSFALSLANVIISILMGLQIARVLRGFGTIKKLAYQLFISFITLVIYIPIAFSSKPSYSLFPILMAIMEVGGLFFFQTANKRLIMTNAQIYMLINGHAKKLY